MIVRMKKIAIVVGRGDADSALETLRSLGLVHLEHVKPPTGGEIAALQDEIKLIDTADGMLAEFSGRMSPCSQPDAGSPHWQPIAQHIVDLYKRADQLSEYARHLSARISSWECWGDFDPAAVRELEKRDVTIGFYLIPKKGLKELPQDVIVKVCHEKKGMIFCAIIADKRRSDIPFKPLELPDMSLETMRRRFEESARALQHLREQLRQAAAQRGCFVEIRKRLGQDLEYARALRGMGQEGELSYITGYIPYDAVDTVEATAKNLNWGLLVTDPGDDEVVPTLIRNPSWIALIKPVFKLLEIIPGYRELDISFWFLLFFSVFFGMLIGDAGYGAIFFLLTLWAQSKWGKSVASRTPFILSYFLSLCAVAWGLLTGTFFGQEWLPARVQPLLPALRNDVYLQRLCFFIGALHLSIAHAWKTALKLPSLTALVEVGWILILWGAYFLAKLLILGEPFPPYARWLFAAGAGCVVFFTKPQRNILKGLGAGTGNLLLNAINNFTDVVSYIRLFAVGLAAVAVADAFNSMAAGVGFNGFLAGLGASLILLLGHLLNLVLGPMSILVHGVRLNVLEFSSHLEMKWTGFSYRPFKKA